MQRWTPTYASVWVARRLFETAAAAKASKRPLGFPEWLATEGALQAAEAAAPATAAVREKERAKFVAAARKSLEVHAAAAAAWNARKNASD